MKNQPVGGFESCYQLELTVHLRRIPKVTKHSRQKKQHQNIHMTLSEHFVSIIHLYALCTHVYCASPSSVKQSPCFQSAGSVPVWSMGGLFLCSTFFMFTNSWLVFAWNVFFFTGRKNHWIKQKAMATPPHELNPASRYYISIQLADVSQVHKAMVRMIMNHISINNSLLRPLVFLAYCMIKPKGLYSVISWDPQEVLEDVVRDRDIWTTSLSMVPPWHGPL